MMELKGVPPPEVLEVSSRKKLFFSPDFKPLVVQNSRGKKRVPGTKDLSMLLRC